MVVVVAGLTLCVSRRALRRISVGYSLDSHDRYCNCSTVVFPAVAVELPV